MNFNAVGQGTGPEVYSLSPPVPAPGTSPEVYALGPKVAVPKDINAVLTSRTKFPSKTILFGAAIVLYFLLKGKQK